LSPSTLKQFLLPFCFALLGLLVFYLLSNHFCIQTDGISTVPSRPVMIAPIGLLLQLAKLVQYPNGRSPLDGPNIFENRYLRGYHPEQVDMIYPNIQFNGFTPKPFRKGPYAIFNLLRYIVCENSVSLLCYPYYMILAVSYRL
jgi:hypothetical protein